MVVTISFVALHLLVLYVSALLVTNLAGTMYLPIVVLLGGEFLVMVLHLGHLNNK